MASEIHEGGCLCGQVRYRVTGPLADVIACHCRMCRRTSGHHVAATAAPRECFELTESAGLAWYCSSETSRRGFCKFCGSSLVWEPNFADYVAVSAGSLDGPTGLKVARHIFVKDKPDWYEITDGAEQFDGSMYTSDL